jgi:hypothetical protein
MTELVVQVPNDELVVHPQDDDMVISVKTDAVYRVSLVVGIVGPQGPPGSSAGAPAYREVTAAGDIDVETDDFIIGVNKTVGAATTVNFPPSADRDGSAVILKDIKGDAGTNPITPAFDGGELCDGLSGSSFVINVNYGTIAFYPRDNGWYTL